MSKKKYSSSGLTDIGELRTLTIRCISETGWFNTAVFLNDVKNGGGLEASQYEMPWSESGVKEGFNGDNRGGYAALIETEGLDGERRCFLLDIGWNEVWMEKRFQEEGLINPLENGEIEFAFISHEHFDHYWGLPFICKYNPELPLYIPSTFYPEAYRLIEKAGHKGKVVEHKPGYICTLFPGCACFTLDLPVIFRVQGEQILVFRVKDKGLVVVTGCCHPGIINVLEHVRQHIAGEEAIYGIYGGLHISPFNNWDSSHEGLIQTLGEYNIQQIGCNHCTGIFAIQKMLEAGLPLVTGTGRNMSQSNLCLGNGDKIVF